MRFCLFFLLFLVGCSTSVESIKSEAPYAKYIHLIGNINSALTYKLKVKYITTVNESACQDYHISLGRYVAKNYEAAYYPVIEGDHHNIKLPLNELDSGTQCKWKPVGVSFCGALRGEESSKCTSIYAFNGQHSVDEITMECSKDGWCFRKNNSNVGLIDRFNKEYLLHVENR